MRTRRRCLAHKLHMFTGFCRRDRDDNNDTWYARGVWRSMAFWISSLDFA